MYSIQTTIRNATGLHARPASDFIALAKRFEAKIEIANLSTGHAANAKSVIKLIALSMSKDTPVELRAWGEDEREAVDALVGLIDSGFGES